MANCNFVIQNLSNDLVLTSYSTVLANCHWGNANNAVCFETMEAANSAIGSWGEQPGISFVGQNPKPR